MPGKKPAREGVASFKTADQLLREEGQMTENQRRLQQWADLMIRERKLDPAWHEDADAASTVRWIGDRLAPLPEKKKPARRAGP